MRGDARVSPDVTAGFNILMDVITGPTTSSVTAGKEDVSLTVVAKDGTGSAVAGLQTWTEDVTVRIRDANVWIEHKALGRLTLGHLTNPGPQNTIDLGGTAVAAHSAPGLVGGSFAFRNSATGAATGATISNNSSNGADYSQPYRLDHVDFAEHWWLHS